MPQNGASDQGLHYLLTEISKENPVKNVPETPKTRNGLIQVIRMDKSTGQNRVKVIYPLVLHNTNGRMSFYDVLNMHIIRHSGLNLFGQN